MLDQIFALTEHGEQSDGDCAFAIHTNPSDFPPSQKYWRRPYYPAVNIFCVVNRIMSLVTVS